MPVTPTELFKSREGNILINEDEERIFSLEGSDDAVELKTALLTEAPATVLNVDGGEMQRDDGYLEQIGPSLWIGRVKYRKNAGMGFSIPPLGNARYSFDTTGGSQHITQSRSTINSYSSDAEPAPDLKGAIGITAEGTVDGCDIEVPVYNWEETHILNDSVVDESYRVLVAIMSGAVNNSSFRGFASGEVLFRGARGSNRPDGNWEITFMFGALPNVSGGELLGEPFEVGDITITTKKGWDYLWVYYKETDFTVGSVTFLMKTPRFAYVERVRPYADLDQLGLPEPD